MDEAELNEILKKIESELTGDPEQDFDILDSWGEKYRGQPGSEILLQEIGRRLYELVLKEDPELPGEIFNDMVGTADEDYAEACRLIEEQQYEEALGKLLVLQSLIRHYPLSDDMIWTDFSSDLESLVFQDYFAEEIGKQEIARHPMHPAKMLYTLGCLLIEMNRPDEAQEPLEMLLSFDPVCPKYLFEMGEAYKRTGQFQKVFDSALWALQCASTRSDLARAYRDMAYSLSESGAFEDAIMLYLLSLNYYSSRHAETEIAWIRAKTGLSVDGYSFDSIANRCRELDIPVGISETVQRNVDFLKMMEDIK